jgi:hypothetical protein
MARVAQVKRWDSPSPVAVLDAAAKIPRLILAGQWANAVHRPLAAQRFNRSI